MKAITTLRLSIAASAVLASITTLNASEKKTDESISALKQITVSASRVEQDINETAASISVITAEDIEKNMAFDIKDMFRYEPDVSVRFQPNRGSAAFYSTGRGGNEGINIRGLEGNQVLIQTDGMRLPQAYSSGPFSAGRGDYIDVEGYKAAEILRGPASTMYGSDGLAGAVSFATKDPSDLLTLGKSYQSAVKLGYSSVDTGYSISPSFAAKGDIFEGLILGSFKNGHESETKGNNAEKSFNRTVNNPQDISSSYLLAKLIFKPSFGHLFKLSAEKLERKVETDVYSLLKDPQYLTTTKADSSEDINRDAVKLDYEYSNPKNHFAQKAKLSAYYQKSENIQYGYEARTNTTGWNTRWRENSYEEETVGVSMHAESNFGKAITHRIVYGADTSKTDVSIFNDGANLLNNQIVTGTANGFAPKRNFPNTEYTLAGAFLQDEIGVSKFSVIPGFRYDSFKLDPEADSLYKVNNSLAPASLSDGAFSPKLGIVWKGFEAANIYAQYSKGFKAPTPSNVNGGTTNLSQNYKSIGNPDLKPETSDSYEIGFKGGIKNINYAGAAFYSTCKDFIASGVKVSGAGTAANPTVYQSVNYSDVEIRGYELKGDWGFAPNWSVAGAFSKTWGHSKISGQKTPLNTIEPAKLVTSIRYDDGSLNGAMHITKVESKSNPDNSLYSPAGYETFDLTAGYKLSKNASVNVGIFNLFDKKYYQWADVRDIGKNSTVIDVYSQAGRNFSANLKYQF